MNIGTESDYCSDGIVEAFLYSKESIWPFWHTECDRVKKTFRKHLPSIDSGMILDWGCSEGITTHELANLYANCNITGLDCNIDCISRAKLSNNNSRINFISGDGYFMNDLFGDSKFNMVVMMNNIWYVANSLETQRLSEIMSEVTSHICSGGYLLLSTTGSSMILQKNDDIFEVFYHKLSLEELAWSSDKRTLNKLLGAIGIQDSSQKIIDKYLSHIN